MITVNEFMTFDPYTLHPDDLVEDAWKIMTEKHIRHIPVTDNVNRLLGLVTQRDVLAATEPNYSDRHHLSPQLREDVRLSDIMIRNVSVIHQGDSLRQAALYLQSHKYGCLPVVSGEKLTGIITDSDFIAIAINLLEQAELAEEEMEIDTLSDSEDIVSPPVGDLN